MGIHLMVSAPEIYQDLSPMIHVSPPQDEFFTAKVTQLFDFDAKQLY